MFRFYRKFAEHLLLVLVYVRDHLRGDEDINSISKYVQTHWTDRAESSEEGQMLVTYFRNYMDRTGGGYYETMDSLDAMINQLLEQLTQTDRVNDSSLIDTIVTILKLPYAQNVISGQMVEKLRKAILLPDEMAGLVERLGKKEMSCSECGHEFVAGEMAVIFQGSRGNGLVTCTNCHHAISMACPTCEQGHSQIVPKVDKMLYTKVGCCVKCKEAAANPPAIVDPVPDSISTASGSTIHFSPIGTSPAASRTPVADGTITFRTIPGGRRMEVTPNEIPFDQMNVPLPNLYTYSWSDSPPLGARIDDIGTPTPNAGEAVGTFGDITRSTTPAWRTEPISTQPPTMSEEHVRQRAALEEFLSYPVEPTSVLTDTLRASIASEQRRRREQAEERGNNP